MGIDVTKTLETVRRQGFAHLPALPPEGFAALVSEFGTSIFRTEVKVKAESRALVTSNRGLDFHTDHHKARFIAWYCHAQTDAGGISILLDAWKLLNQMSAQEKDALRQIRLKEHKVFPEDLESLPMLQGSNLKPEIYYSFWLCDSQQKQHPAFQKFRKLTETEPPIELLLKPGEALVIDNHRMLHGRTSITGTQNRFLERHWIN